MKVSELSIEVNRLTAAVTMLIAHDKAMRAEIRELRARRQPDTLDRRAAGMTEYQAARKAIIAEQNLALNAWVANTLIRARMEALRPPPPATEEVVL